MISIVLTGTIVPNCINTKVNMIETRRLEYLKAIKYYLQFTDVFFLENSIYDFKKDKDFEKIDGLTIIKYPPSNHFNEGKGYQEFEMLDAFVRSRSYEERFIKITGRYIVKNFDQIFNECKEDDSLEFIIDASKSLRWARTYLFYFNIAFYREYILGIYNKVNEAKYGNDASIERLVFNQLMSKKCNFRPFYHERILEATCGGSGQKMPNARFYKRIIMNLLRRWYIYKKINFLP